MRMNRTANTILGAIVLSAGLTACGTSEEGAEATGEEVAVAEEMTVIEERQANFEGIGDAFMAIRGQLEEASPDFGVIAASAQTIDTNANKISGYFPEGTGMDSGADTEALATIWEQPEEFAAAIDRLTGASAGLVEAAASEDVEVVGAAVMNLGGACMNCHETFRLDDES